MAKAKDKDASGASFEADLEKLEEIVHALEEGGLPLDEALKQFEAGMQLKRKCEKALSAAEKRIEMLIENSENELDTVPFDEDVAAAEAAKPAKKPVKKSAPVVEDDIPEPPDEEEGDDDSGELLF